MLGPVLPQADEPVEKLDLTLVVRKLRYGARAEAREEVPFHRDPVRLPGPGSCPLSQRQPGLLIEALHGQRVATHMLDPPTARLALDLGHERLRLGLVLGPRGCSVHSLRIRPAHPPEPAVVATVHERHGLPPPRRPRGEDLGRPLLEAQPVGGGTD